MLYGVTISRAKWQWTTVRIEAEDKAHARGHCHHASGAWHGMDN